MSIRLFLLERSFNNNLKIHARYIAEYEAGLRAKMIALNIEVVMNGQLKLINELKAKE